MTRDYDQEVRGIKPEDLQYLCGELCKNNRITAEDYAGFQNVKRGLRNSDGTGVVAGLTRICNVHGYVMDEGEKMPVDGRLIYRGIDIMDIVKGCESEDRFGFEEVVWLLLFGDLPTAEQLSLLREVIESTRELPDSFTEDMIMKAPSPNVMNKLARSVLALYSYDENAEDPSIENNLRQSIQLIARMPTIMVAAYEVKRHYYDHRSMYLHPAKPGHSIAENILYTIRADKQFTDKEAKMLDLCLMLHAEHGGGNNSTFATRVLTSSGTDIYSAIAAGIGSLKGPKHGGANHKVMEMLDCIEENVPELTDAAMTDFINKIMDKDAGDGSGLIYGMGHAVYTKSDPRAVLLKSKAIEMASGTDYEREFKILDAVERLTPGIFRERKHTTQTICANVDLYSGLVYRMLNIPPDIYTPLFAISRTAGWCAHRIEELISGDKIIRPAYKSISETRDYVPLESR